MKRIPQQAIHQLLSGLRGTVGLYIHVLDTDEVFELNPERVYPSASVIKIPVMWEFYRQVSLGEVNPQDPFVLHDCHKVGSSVYDSGILREMHDGIQLTYQDILRLMIIISDDTATNIMLDLLGMWLTAIVFAVAETAILPAGREHPRWATVLWAAVGNLVFVGVFIALVVEVLGIPVLPFAIGLYLPIYLSVPMMLGGLLRWYLEKRKYASEKDKDNTVQSGVLYSSGLIAGEGIVGILLAVLAVIPMGLNAEGKQLYVSDKINISEIFSIGNIGGLICFALILLTIYFFAVKDSKKK